MSQHFSNDERITKMSLGVPFRLNLDSYEFFQVSPTTSALLGTIKGTQLILVNQGNACAIEFKD